MNRNSETRFATAPVSLDIGRSTFNRDSEVKMTGNIGDLCCFYVDEVLPGDSFQIKTSKVARLQTLLTPIMDNVYMDFYWFFVPNRLIWNHWKEFMGENNQSAWVPTTTYTVPQVTAPSGGWSVGTIADQMGLPVGVGNISVSALPFRAYALIVDQWFRSEVLQNPVNVPDGDSTTAGSNGSNYINDLAKGGKPFVVNRPFDYFSAALPEPQKGNDVSIPITTSPMEVIGVDTPFSNSNNKPVQYKTLMQPTWQRSLYDSNNNSQTSQTNIQGATGAVSSTTNGRVVFNNLYAIPQSSAIFGTINQLRIAFQLQKLLERDAISGTRYTEVLRGHFRVSSPDARIQRTEYLGGNRVYMNVNQIIQQSESTSSSPLGNVAAMSLTTDVHNDFSKSFVEHGLILGLCCARYNTSYQQGIEKFWSRKDRYSFYWPVLANIGNQPIENKELYAQGSTVLNPVTGVAYDDEVFGYQEAWADYRYKPSHVTGEMRSNASQPLDSWHLADYYTSMPTLGSSWLQVDKSNVDRTLAVTSAVSNQFFMDILIQNKTTRPMPLYSVPGLIDHH